MKKTAAGSDDYTEDALVEQPAIDIFRDMGWETANAFNETPTNCFVTGRETNMEVVFKARLRPALERLNPNLPDEALNEAINQFLADKSMKTIVGANQDTYEMLRDGIQVRFRDSDHEMKEERVKLIDWDNPRNNDFLLVSQLWVAGSIYTRRPDLIGFVNGIPLVFIELKAVHENLRNAFDGNLSDYKDTIPHLFWYNGFIILSNLAESVVGTVTSDWESFTEWKKVESEEESAQSSLETTLRGTCEPARLLDIIENFILYEKVRGGLEKVVGRYHQYFGVNNVIEAVHNIDKKKGRLRVY